MPSKIIPITNLPEFGVVKDPPTVGLAPNVFTDARNMRFRDMAAWKMKGEIALTADLNATMAAAPGSTTAGEIVFVTWWNNPNLIPANHTYYVFIIEQINGGNVVGHRAFLYRANLSSNDAAQIVDITPTTLNSNAGFTSGYTASGSYKGNWQATEFAGGFCVIINNGLDKPHYIMDTAGNTTIGSVPKFAGLPAWDSYNLETKILEATVRDEYGTAETGSGDTVDGYNKRLFDLGQKVDFTTTTFFVTKQTPNETTTECTPVPAATDGGTNNPGTEPPSGGVIPDGFIPGTVPGSPATNPPGDNFQYCVYTDSESNTTKLLFNTNIVSKDVVRVFLISRKPITNTCGVIRAFGNFLVAGNLKETTTDGTINEMPGVVRTSDVAVPGSVPQNWNPFAAGTNTADEFTLSDTSTVQDMIPLQGNLYIYTNTSIHNLRLTNSLVTPVAFTPVTAQYGCQTTDCVVEFDGKHLIVGSNDIYLFSGNPGNITSISDARIRDYFYTNLNTAKANLLFTLRNQANDEIWICYPKGSNTTCNEALIYNFRLNNWTIRDLPNVVSGVIAPVKGAAADERPWATGIVSFDKLFPVFAQVTSAGSNSKGNIIAADIGYQHKTTAPTMALANYTSYLEHESLSMTPEFYTEQFHSTALLAQGRGILRITSITTNAPASSIDFTAAASTSIKKGLLRISSNDSYNSISGPSYKSDVRLNGRFISYRIDDADPSFNTNTAASTTALNGAISSTTSTADITVDSTASFQTPLSGGTLTIYIDSEQITYTGLTATTFTGIVRARNSTAGATHLNNAAVYSVPYSWNLVGLQIEVEEGGTR